MTTTTRTAARATTTRSAHNTVCGPAAPNQRWTDRCLCTHIRSRHDACTHTPTATPAGTCTGRNNAGHCLWPTCPCTTFTDLTRGGTR